MADSIARTRSVLLDHVEGLLAQWGQGKEEAEDIVQEVSLLAFEKRNQLSGLTPVKFWAWACRAARFKLLNFLRRLKASERLGGPVLSIDVLSRGAALWEPHAKTPSAQSDLEHEELSALMVAEILTVRGRGAEIFLRLCVHGERAASVAQDLGCSSSTVHQRKAAFQSKLLAHFGRHPLYKDLVRTCKRGSRSPSGSPPCRRRRR